LKLISFFSLKDIDAQYLDTYLFTEPRWHLCCVC